MLTGHRLDVDLPPGSPQWLATVSASQIATITGLSRWSTPHTLWHLKRGTRPADPQTDDQARGHQFEPLIRQWFAEQNRGKWIVAETGTWQHDIRQWQTANPDALLIPDNGETFPEQDPTALLEIKTDDDMRDWVDGVPGFYRQQATWQMDVTGLRRVYFAVCGPFELFYRTPKVFIVDYDVQEANALREQAIRFMQSIELGIEPDPDYRHEDDRLTLRYQHRTVEAAPPVELPDDLAIPYLTALADAKRIEGDKAEWSSKVAAFLGDRKTASWNGHTLGSRKKTDPPTFSAAPKLAERADDILNPKESNAA